MNCPCMEGWTSSPEEVVPGGDGAVKVQEIFDGPVMISPSQMEVVSEGVV